MKKILWLCLISWLCAACATPQSELANYLHNFNSMQANFTQVISDSNHKIIYKSAGQMALSRPGKFRWQTISPSDQLILANQKTIWIYDADLAQATKQTQTNEDSHSPAMLLTQNNQNLLTNFIITQQGSNFYLMPKNSTHAYFKKIQLTFNHEQLTAMQILDKLDQTTLIQFSHIQINPELSKQVFLFNPPPNVEIIDNTHANS